jgi:hypothetical protein
MHSSVQKRFLKFKNFNLNSFFDDNKITDFLIQSILFISLSVINKMVQIGQI